VKSFSVLILSAALTVPCFANAVVSANSPGLPAPRDMGGKSGSFAMSSPGLPAPRDMGKS
jgi:hypothetical protein